MHSVPLFRSSALRPLLDYLQRLDSRAELAALGRSALLVRDPGGLLPLALGGEVFARAAEVLGAPDLGLRVGEASSLERIGEFGEILRRAPTLGAALCLAVQLGSRFNTGQRIWLALRGAEVWLQLGYARALDAGRQPTMDFALAMTLNLFRLAAGPGWRATEIHFEGPPPAHAERLAALAGRVRFGEGRSAVIFPRATLALPLPAFAPSEPARESGRGGALPSSDVQASLRQTVDALVRLGRANVAAVAQAAGTSARTLQRRLAAGGQSFNALLDQARCRAACRMLADADRKVIDVSAALGYSDAANFTRAFRRWTGVSPQEFRRASLSVAAS